MGKTYLLRCVLNYKATPRPSSPLCKPSFSNKPLFLENDRYDKVNSLVGTRGGSLIEVQQSGGG